MLRRLMPPRGEQGFSLAEMLVTLVVFAILAAIAVPVYLNQRNKSMEESLKTDLINATLIIEEKRAANNGRYPDKLPREVSYDKNATVVYSFPAGRASYCLQMTLNDRKMQVSSASDTPTEVTEANDCSYGVSLSAPRLKGQLTNDNIPQLFWDEIEGAASYNVYANDVHKATIAAGQATYAVNLARQEGGTSVRYRVAAVSSEDIEGERSRAVQLNAPMTPPTVAPTLTIQSASETSEGSVEAILKWNTVPTATKYELFDAVSGDLVTVIPGTTHTVTVPMGQNKTYYVIAVNDAGNGPESNEVTVEGPVLSAPTLSGDIDESLVTTLTWDLVSGAESYRVFRDGAPFGNVSFSGSGKAVITAANSTPGNVYTYTVAAVDSRGREGHHSNEVNIGVSMTKPVLSLGTTPVDTNGRRGAQFVWQRVSGATSYKIYDAANAQLLTTVDGGTTVTTTLTGLVDPTKKRSFYLVAVGPAGDSERSNTVTVTGISPTFSGLNYKQKGEGIAGITLTWTNQPYATGYEIVITGGSSAVTYNAPKGATSWSTSDTYLGSGSSNVIRTFTVRALYAGGAESAAQSQEVFMPARPTNLRATQGTIGHETSRWTWSWTRPGGTSQTQVKFNNTLAYSTLSQESYARNVNHATKPVVEVRAWSPDEKMISQPATITVDSAHPAPWYGSKGQYDFLGTGSGIVDRYHYGGQTRELRYYRASSNGAIAGANFIGGGGWKAMKHITPVYDWQGKGSAGIFAVERATGKAYYYSSLGPTTSSSQQMHRMEIGQGRNWANFRQIAYFHEWGGVPGENAIIVVNNSGTLYRFKTNSDGTLVNSSKQVGSGWGEIANSSDWDGDGTDDLFMRPADGSMRVYQRSNDSMTAAGMKTIGSSGWTNYSFQPYESWGGLRGVQAADNDTGIHYWYPYRAAGLSGSARVQNGTGWQTHWETGAGKPANCHTISVGDICN